MARKLRTFQRSKRRFKTARAAWTSISLMAGVAAALVVRTAHTRTHWVFKVR